MIRKFLLATAISALAISTAACNTVRGAANDMESVANEVDKKI